MTRAEIMQLSGEALWEAVCDAMHGEPCSEGNDCPLYNDEWECLGAIFRHVRGWPEDEQEQFDLQLTTLVYARSEGGFTHNLDPADAARALLIVKGMP